MIPRYGQLGQTLQRRQTEDSIYLEKIRVKGIVCTF